MTDDSTPAEGKKVSRKAELKRLFNLCEDLEVRGPDRGVLAALWVHTDDSGWCYPSVGTLALMSGLTERRVRTSLITLGRLGIVPSVKAKRSGELKAGAVKLRRGQSLFLVWPLATALARETMVAYRPGALAEPVEGRQWFIRAETGVAGPFSAAEARKMAESGQLRAGAQVKNGEQGWISMGLVPVLARGLPLLPE